MKMRVKLHGTLIQRFPGYQHSQGIEVEIPNRTTVNELLVLLGISDSQKAVVAIDGRIRKANDRIQSGACAQIFQPVHGG